jgi:hypothetical protein
VAHGGKLHEGGQIRLFFSEEIRRDTGFFEGKKAQRNTLKKLW